MRNASVGLIFLGSWLCAQFAHAELVEKRLAVDPRGDVEVNNVAGTVKVTAWDRPEIEVRAELGSSAERLEFERDGDSTRIRVILKRESSSGGSDLTISVPQDSRLTVHTVSATQKVSGMRNLQRLHSVSGRIDAQAVGDELEAKSVSGDIWVKGENVKPDAEARTRVTSVSGDLHLTNVGGDLELNTVNGEIEVAGSTIDRGRIKTTNGEITLTSELARNAALEVESLNGDVELLLKQLADVEFDVQTFNGDIESCFEQKARPTRERGPGSELRFKRGEGSDRVRVKTLNGDVHICDK